MKKVREIEHAGGKLGLIVDEEDNETMDEIIMADDGTGSGVTIPSIMVNKKQGELLIAHYTNKPSERNRTKLVATFDINKPDDRVEYDIWVSSSNDRGLDFIKDF